MDTANAVYVVVGIIGALGAIGGTFYVAGQFKDASETLSNAVNKMGDKLETHSEQLADHATRLAVLESRDD